MSRKVVLVQRYELELSDECNDMSNEKLVSDFNIAYQIHGKLVVALGTKSNYKDTKLESIDGKEVFIGYNDEKGGEYVSNVCGTEIILDGEELDNRFLSK